MPPTPTLKKRSVVDNDDDHFYYFAYGSNLLSERIHCNNPTAKFVAAGLLKGYKLWFHKYSGFWQGASATIAPVDCDTELYGVVWRMSVANSDSLDQQEKGYQRLDVQIELQNGSRDVITCRTYEMIGFVPPCGDLPSPHYKHVIVSGAIEHELPMDYIEKLKSLPDNGYIGCVQLKLEALKELNSTAV